MLLQLCRQFFSIGIAQVTNLRITTVFEWRIQVRDERPESQALVFVTPDQHAVRACVGNETGGDLCAVRAGRYVNAVMIRTISPADA